MGVPSFYRWLCAKYPRIVHDAIEEAGIEVDGKSFPVNAANPNPNGFEIDNLYLDMNGIIHPCCHPEGEEAPPTEEAMIEKIFVYIDRIFACVRPRKLLYMAIDGVAPRAKMNQQRSRRFRAAGERLEQAELDKQLRKKFHDKGMKTPAPPPPVWDSNVITPGTPFMAKLSIALQYYVSRRLTEDPGWQGIKVIFSDARVPGEGEHKIMAYIRNQRSQPGYNPNLVHCLYGMDADLIMLALSSHEPNFYIFREVVFAKNERKCFVCGQAGHTAGECTGQPPPEEGTAAALVAQYDDGKTGPAGTINHSHESRTKPYQFLNIGTLRYYLEEALRMDVPWWDFERAVDDWIFLCFFVGNDFLPHLPSLEIFEGAIDMMVDIYKTVLPSLGNYLTESGKLNLTNIDVFVSSLGRLERAIFLRRARNDQENQRRQLEKERRNQVTEQRNADMKAIVNGEQASVADVPTVPPPPPPPGFPSSGGAGAGASAPPPPSSTSTTTSTSTSTASSNVSAAQALREQLKQSKKLKAEASTDGSNVAASEAEGVVVHVKEDPATLAAATLAADALVKSEDQEMGLKEEASSGGVKRKASSNSSVKEDETDTGLDVPTLEMPAGDSNANELIPTPGLSPTETDAIKLDDDEEEGAVDAEAEAKAAAILAKLLADEELKAASLAASASTDGGVTPLPSPVPSDDSAGPAASKPKKQRKPKAEGSKIEGMDDEQAFRTLLNVEKKRLEKLPPGPDESYINYGAPGYEARYYSRKMGIEIEDPADAGALKALLKAYVEGLAWVFEYYFIGCPSWEWYYPYHYAPLVASLLNVDEFDVSFNRSSKPFLPFQQLLGVFPAASSHALPTPMAELMVSPESSISDFYPERFALDLNGQHAAWKAVVLLPFIDEKRLVAASERVEPLLTLEEKERNSEGCDYIFVHATNALANTFCSLATLKSANTHEVPTTKMGEAKLSRDPNTKLRIPLDPKHDGLFGSVTPMLAGPWAGRKYKGPFKSMEPITTQVYAGVFCMPPSLKHVSLILEGCEIKQSFLSHLDIMHDGQRRKDRRELNLDMLEHTARRNGFSIFGPDSANNRGLMAVGRGPHFGGGGANRRGLADVIAGAGGNYGGYSANAFGEGARFRREMELHRLQQEEITKAGGLRTGERPQTGFYGEFGSSGRGGMTSSNSTRGGATTGRGGFSFKHPGSAVGRGGAQQGYPHGLPPPPPPPPGHHGAYVPPPPPPSQYHASGPYSHGNTPYQRPSHVPPPPSAPGMRPGGPVPQVYANQQKQQQQHYQPPHQQQQQQQQQQGQRFSFAPPQVGAPGRGALPPPPPVSGPTTQQKTVNRNRFEGL